MADTRRLAALKAVESTLNGVGKPTGFTAHRHMYKATQLSDMPHAIIAHGGGQSRNFDVNDITENRDLIRIAIEVQGSRTTEPDDSIDPYLSWVLSSLEADPTLGGVLNEMELQPTGPTSVDEGDYTYVRIVQDIHVIYYHNRLDPESQT